VRLASLNLLHGRSPSDGLVVPDRLRDAVRALAADVLGLQEVDRGQPRSHGLDLTREAAEAMGAAHWRFVPALVGTPGSGWRAAHAGDDEYAGPSYGCGLVSRYPVTRWHTVRLPATRARSPIVLPGSRRIRWLQDEPRVAIAAVVATPGGPMTVATTHLSFVPGWNALQLRRLCRALDGLPGPRVLLGDLNMPPPFPRLVSGWRPLAKVATYPSTDPRVQIDHVLGSGRLPPVTTVEARTVPVSDHQALVVEW
jgi:endonuclease/exonuclease/phosphatase family metal-dependent hydrolase